VGSRQGSFSQVTFVAETCKTEEEVSHMCRLHFIHTFQPILYYKDAPVASMTNRLVYLGHLPGKDSNTFCHKFQLLSGLLFYIR
jgi:hypothetical protein